MAIETALHPMTSTFVVEVMHPGSGRWTHPNDRKRFADALAYVAGALARSYTTGTLPVVVVTCPPSDELRNHEQSR